MICSNCYNEHNFEIREEREVICVRGEDIEIFSKVTYCKDCGTKVWNPEHDNNNLKLAYNLYRKKHNLLTPEEIIAIRERYGISQTTFAKVLGLGEKTIARYENGSIQDAAQNNLILLSKNINNFKTLFEQQFDRLDDGEKKKINEALMKFTPRVVSSNKYSTPINLEDYYFGGFTNAERDCEYTFNSAVSGL